MPASPTTPAGLALTNPKFGSIVTSPYTVTTDDGILQTNLAGGTTVNLPQAATVPPGWRVVIQNVGSAGTTSVVPSEAGPDDTINGTDAAFTTGLTTQWGSVVFISDGVSNWIAVAGS